MLLTLFPNASYRVYEIPYNDSLLGCNITFVPNSK